MLKREGVSKANNKNSKSKGKVEAGADADNEKNKTIESIGPDEDHCCWND